MAALIAAVIVLSLSTLVAFAYGNQIIQLLGGGMFESGRTADGGHFVSVTMSEADPDPIEVRDGRVYFTMDGSETDITSYCTEATYYQYEQMADNGYRQVLIVGGRPDNLGWAEFLWDSEGNHLASSMRFDSMTGAENPRWYELAAEEFGIARMERVSQ